MIITTELNAKQLVQLDEALGSRILYAAGNYVVEFKHNLNSNYRIK
jgi:hypothetical protein